MALSEVHTLDGLARCYDAWLGGDVSRGGSEAVSSVVWNMNMTEQIRASAKRSSLSVASSAAVTAASCKCHNMQAV